VKRLYIKLETLASLSLRADHAALGVNSTSYITGNTLLGSLAAAHRLSYPNKKDEFERLFLRESILYPNLYPAGTNDTLSFWQDIHRPVYPVPRTAQSCKRYSGFLYPKTETNDAHGVRDTVIDWAVFKLGMKMDERERRFDPLDMLLAHKKCTLCKEPMDYFSGYYRRSDTLREMIAMKTAATRLQTRVGVDRESRTARGGIFYHRQVFDEGTFFWGEIKILDDQLIEGFKNFVNDVSTLLRMGTDRTRGMGKVKIEVIEPTEEVYDRRIEFGKRMQNFNTLLIEQMRSKGLERLLHHYFFTITLHSPLILSDESLRYRGTIDANVLEELLQMPVEGLEQVYQNTSMKQVMGWQELWGTPRPGEQAIDTGSVFLFRCDKADSKVIDALFELEERGIGKRRAEGFGRICVSDPFHKEVALK
jgi:CRISPR-associated Csx10 family RAMP protein